EAKLWGIDLIHLSEGEERVLEDANHLVYLVSRDEYSKLKDILDLKDTNNFLKDLENLRKDFFYFKKKVKERDNLKNLITKFTIKQVNHNNYQKLENIFLLEKQLYEVLEYQEQEFVKLFSDLPKMKLVSEEDKIKEFIFALKKIRDILSGHMDFYSIWEEERAGYSNSSNIIHSLIKVVSSDLEEAVDC
ncbi:MAG: hypothetical protein KC589_11360, partial [Nanoarchaeota archaeon]|nr:hypothetical protein [Nanoarchaeota archaeon]